MKPKNQGIPEVQRIAPRWPDYAEHCFDCGVHVDYVPPGTKDVRGRLARSTAVQSADGLLCEHCAHHRDRRARGIDDGPLTYVPPRLNR